MCMGNTPSRNIGNVRFVDKTFLVQLLLHFNGTKGECTEIRRINRVWQELLTWLVGVQLLPLQTVVNSWATMEKWSILERCSLHVTFKRMYWNLSNDICLQESIFFDLGINNHKYVYKAASKVCLQMLDGFLAPIQEEKSV